MLIRCYYWSYIVPGDSRVYSRGLSYVWYSAIWLLDILLVRLLIMLVEVVILTILHGGLVILAIPLARLGDLGIQ